MIVIAALALIAISLYARQLGSHERLSRYGLALILGGAFGNLIDRMLSGYVIDFVDVYWHDAHFWAFNVADAAITIGAVLTGDVARRQEEREGAALVLRALHPDLAAEQARDLTTD